MTVAALIAIASAGFVAPGSLSISTACSRPVRALTPMASGGDLAAVGHVDAVEISLTGAQRLLLPTNMRQTYTTSYAFNDSKGMQLRTLVESGSSYRTGGQRRKLRDKGKSLQSFAVPDVQKAVSDVQSMLASELVKLKFVSCEKKPDAQVLANELAAMTGAAVAECIGNECLLYRPPRDGQARKYAI